MERVGPVVVWLEALMTPCYVLLTTSNLILTSLSS